MTSDLANDPTQHDVSHFIFNVPNAAANPHLVQNLDNWATGIANRGGFVSALPSGDFILFTAHVAPARPTSLTDMLGGAELPDGLASLLSGGMDVDSLIAGEED